MNQRAAALAGLLRTHPGLTADAEQLARSLLGPGDRDRVAREVIDTLLVLQLGDLAERAGSGAAGTSSPMKRLTNYIDAVRCSGSTSPSLAGRVSFRR